MTKIELTSDSLSMTTAIGEKIGTKLRGGEVIELISDLGGGKTSLTKGISRGFGSIDPVSSPSFTISNIYRRKDGKQIHHFDFYRLDDAGIVGSELAEVVNDPNVVLVVEWGEVVESVLPENKITIKIKTVDEEKRLIEIDHTNEFSYLFKNLKL